MALFAAMALCAFGAQGASATTHAWTLSNGVKEADITGISTTKDVFSANGLGMQCKTVATGTVDETEETPIVTPHYTECTGPIGGAAVVHNNGCSYVFHGETDGNEHATVDLNCKHEKEIVITTGVGGCNLTFGDTHSGEVTVNQGLRGIHYDDQGTGNETDIEITATVDGITYIGSEVFVCEFLEVDGTRHNWSWDAEWTVKVYKDGVGHTEQIGLGLETE